MIIVTETIETDSQRLSGLFVNPRGLVLCHGDVVTCEIWWSVRGMCLEKGIGQAKERAVVFIKRKDDNSAPS